MLEIRLQTNSSSERNQKEPKIKQKSMFKQFQQVNQHQSLKSKQPESLNTFEQQLFRKKAADKKKSEIIKQKVSPPQKLSLQLVESSETESETVLQRDNSSLKVKIFGGVILVSLVVMIFVHAFSSQINYSYFDLTNNAFIGAGFMMASIFIVLGFGLLFAYHGQSIFAAFFSVIYILSSTLIIGPFLAKFWINLFFGGFFGDLPISHLGLTIMLTSNNGSTVNINYWNMKLMLCCVISQLLIHFAAIGRLQIYKIVLSNIFFLIVWTLNFGLVSYIFSTSTEDRIQDDFNICFVYLFGGFAGLIVIFDTPSRILIKKSIKYQPFYPKIISVLGLFFLWMSFAFTFAIPGRKDNSSTYDINNSRLLFYPQGCLGIFFALSSSVLSTAAFSIIFNGNHILNLNDFLGSSISGAIMFGPVAGFTQNLSIPIILGIGSGFLSVLYTSKILPRVNEKYQLDSLGVLGPFFIIPIIANFFTTPIITYSYYNNTILTPQLNNISIQSNTAKFLLVYYIIAVGLGVICGMMVSWSLRCLKGNENLFGDRLMYTQELSLRQFKIDYEQNSTDIFTDLQKESSQSSEKGKEQKRKKKERNNETSPKKKRIGKQSL